MSDLSCWDPNFGKLELRESEVHIWRAYIHRTETVLDQLESTLSTDEQVRANRFVFRHDRDCFVGTRGILRELLARYLSCSPDGLQFDYSAQGKPSLRAEIFKQSIQFNVSHSHGLALLAFSVGRDLGVDIEFVRSSFAIEEIADRYFSAREVAELKALPPTMRAEGFFLCWTRKEAYIKARGEGLQIPLDSFHVSLTPGMPERLQSLDSFRWNLRSLSPDPRYVGALAAEGNDWQLRCWNWEPANRD
jgi:4'-phosphopantetheinyl transferase